MSLSELRNKDVVNVPDGRVLGKVMDLEFCPQDGRVQAIVVPVSYTHLKCRGVSFQRRLDDEKP